MATLYYNAAVDNDWNTLGNWWTSDAFSTQASSLPSSSDSVVLSATCDTNSGSEPTVTSLTFNDPAMSYFFLGINITVTGIAGFYGGSYFGGGNGNQLTGNANFDTEAGINLGSAVTGNATFNDSSYNNGTVTGNATFNDSSYNDYSGIVNGNATFNDSSINYTGTVNGNATFNDGAGTNGTVNGNAVFNGSSYSYDNVSEDATFNDSSVNYGTVGWMATFNDGSFNDGTVNGNATFSHNAQNWGTINGENVTFNDSSVNYGPVGGGSATFNDSSFAHPSGYYATVVCSNRTPYPIPRGINGSSILGIV